MRQNRSMTQAADRVIAVASRIYPPEPGAASLRLAALVRELDSSGAVVVVLTSRPPQSSREHDSGQPVSVRIRRAPVLRDRSGYIRGYLQYMSFDIPLFFRLLFSRHIDCVVCEPPPTTGVAVRAACSLRRIPFVYYAADVWSEAAEVSGAPTLVVSAVRAMERFTANGAAAVAAVSPSVASRFAAIAPAARIFEVGNGYDSDVFTSAGRVEESDARYLLYAGTASEVHGAMIFVDALPEVRSAIPDARLVFIGQGSEWAEMQKRAERLAPGSTTFFPRMPSAEIAPWIRGAVATVASVKPGGYEAFPTKMLASVGCGTPVVYSGPNPGYEFAKDPGVGRAVPYEVHAVAQAMIAALTTPPTEDQRTRLSAWARANHSLNAVMSRMKKIIDDALPSGR